MSNYEVEIIPRLSKTFNREAEDVTALLTKYNAHWEKQDRNTYFTIRGVTNKDLRNFAKEFGNLPGVEDLNWAL
jgi:hypothetical protein